MIDQISDILIDQYGSNAKNIFIEREEQPNKGILGGGKRMKTVWNEEGLVSIFKILVLKTRDGGNLRWKIYTRKH